MACGFVGAAEGSPFFPNLSLADRDSLECWSWVRQATGCPGGGGMLGASQGTGAPMGLAGMHVLLGT